MLHNDWSCRLSVGAETHLVDSGILAIEKMLTEELVYSAPPVVNR
jgi:hypothetical protein